MSRVLVIDDEERVRRLLRRALESSGYAVDCAGDAAEGLASVRVNDYDLVVLDLMLPDRAGDELLVELLDERPELRVIVLSAVPEIGARVQVLDAGALDFMIKPFMIAELLARIRARLRDHHQHLTGRFRQVGDLRLDTQRRAVSMGNQQTSLSHREFLLLNHLMQRANQVCSREELLADVWGYQFDPGSNVVDVYVRRLRSKLDGLRKIETVRNVGYCLSAS
jgi:two-component system OmpR family response regulator